MKILFSALMLVLTGATSSSAAIRLVEPTLKLDRQAPGNGPVVPRVALTFDACSGLTDKRILSTLVDNRIPATIFVTARWLRRNAEAFAVLRAHPDLFEIENHGAMHVPAVDQTVSVYGIKAAGSADAVIREVERGGRQSRRKAPPSRTGSAAQPRNTACPRSPCCAVWGIAWQATQ